MKQTPLSDTRDRILDVGTNLLSCAGLSGLTLGTLAEQAGMSKSGLFAHFRSKDELQLRLLDRAAEIAARVVLAPAMAAPEGLPRLRTLIEHWLGWTRSAGLDGGCPVAAGLFELDDQPGPVRDRLLAMEKSWRELLAEHVRQAIAVGHLAPELGVEQFVWELCGIYLSHHASSRFVQDPTSDRRAALAVNSLIARSVPTSGGAKRKFTRAPMNAKRASRSRP